MANGTNDKYVRVSDGATVRALQFTGENRVETRAFFGKTIVIRQGRFFDGEGYVVTNDWLVKEPSGRIYKVGGEEFEAGYL